MFTRFHALIAMMASVRDPLDGVDPKEIGRVAQQLGKGVPEFKSAAAARMVTSLDALLWNARFCYGQGDPRYLAVVKQAREGDASQDYLLADSVPLNTPFTFRLSDNGNGTLTFALDANGQTKSETAPVPPAFSGATVRFQVGAYQQAESEKSATADDGARVTFTKITTDDKPAPAPTQPPS